MGLPLDPFYEAARRQLEDQLQQALAAIAFQRPQLMAQNQLDMARLQTNQGVDLSHLNAGLAGRGLYNSGIRTTDTERLNTGYDRQRQDEAFSLAQALGGLSQQAGAARLNFTQGITEAQMEAARRAAQDPYSPVAKYRHPPKLPNRRP